MKPKPELALQALAGPFAKLPCALTSECWDKVKHVKQVSWLGSGFPFSRCTGGCLLGGLETSRGISVLECACRTLIPQAAKDYSPKPQTHLEAA